MNATSPLIRRLNGLLLACLTLLAVLVARPALAQDPADTDTDAQGLLGAVTDLTDPLVRIKATAVGDGLVRNGEWAALHVRLDNLGDPLTGELRVATRTVQGEDLIYRRQVELPAGVRKQVRLLFKPGVGGQTRRIDFLAGRRSVGADIPLRWVDDSDVAVGVIGDDAAGLAVVRSAWDGRVPARAPMPPLDTFNGSGQRDVSVGLIPTAQVPDRANGLDVFNELVWLDADPTALSPEQAAAVRAWVAGGGHLLLTVTERWRQVGQGPLADLVPVELSGVRDGRGAAALVGRGDVLAPQAIARPRSVDGRFIEVLLADGPDAIWTVGTYGLGTVHVLAVDPRLDPVRSGVPREQLWRQLLWLPGPGQNAGFFTNNGGATLPAFDNLVAAHQLPEADMRMHPRLLSAMDLTAAGTGVGHAGYSDGFSGEDLVFGMQPERWWTETVQFLKDIPGVAPIPMEYLLAFAAVYLLVIGPIDYLVLRALRRQTLTWVTFPVSIVVFSALALVGTSYVKGSQAVVTRFEVIDVLPGTSLWRGESWYGVWSTRSTTLSMTSGRGDGVSELAPGGFKQGVQTVHGTAGSALSWDAQTWTLAYVRTTWTGPGQGGFSASRRGDGSIEIRNGTDLDLTDVVVDIGTQRQRLDSLPAGQTRMISPSGGTSFVPEDYRSEELELDAYRSWAVSNVTDYPEPRRGHVDWGEWDVIITGATTGPVEESVLEGLTPKPRTLTVVRAPLLIQGGS